MIRASLAFALTASIALPAAAASPPRWCAIGDILPGDELAVPAFAERFAKASGCAESRARAGSRAWFCAGESWTFILTPGASDRVVLTAVGYAEPPIDDLLRCGSRRWHRISDFDPGMALFRGELAPESGPARLGVLAPLDYGKTMIRLSLTGSPRRDWSAEDDRRYVSTPVSGVRSAVRLAGVDPTQVPPDELLNRLSAAGARVVYRQQGRRDSRFVTSFYNIDVSPPPGLADVDRIHLYFKADRLLSFVYRVGDRDAFDRWISDLRTRYGEPTALGNPATPALEWSERRTGQGVLTIRAITYGADTAQPSRSIYFINPVVQDQLKPVEDYMSSRHVEEDIFP
jgi:hypothetical protein